MSSDTNTLNVCTNTAYLNSIDQKRRFQLFNIPPQRYNNLANERNPYVQTDPATGTTYTKFELDMRRKSEILKYSSNRMATQTNNLTKAQKFAQAVTGSYQQRTFSQEFIQQNTNNGVLTICPPGTIIKTSTTASDVPGTPIMLYDNPEIPLYNFVNDTNTPYAIINQELNPYSSGFNYSNKTNVLQNDRDTPITIFTLYFLNVSSPYYRFSFITPISLNFTGNYLEGITSPYSTGDSVTINLSSISLTILYSFSAVALISTPDDTFLYNTSMTVDISNNNISSFSGTCYFDTVTFSNIILPSNLGYIYDFQLNIKYNITPNEVYVQNYKIPTIISYFNASTPSTPSLTNCIISGNHSITSPSLTITGEPRQ
jgi:hypothetical protein